MPGGSEVRLLTQEEVAQILRRSVASVARLRRAGELAWLPGSPIRIPETELSAYLDRKMVKRQAGEAAARRKAEGPTLEERAVAGLEKMRRNGTLAGFEECIRNARKR
jgi:hypothetical protein